jgi:hypothetical protein
VTRYRRSIFGQSVIRIAVQPVLAWLRGRDHGVTDRASVFASVAIWRAVTAKCRSTRLARPQMDPVAADLHAFLAFAALWLLDRFNCVQMRTASV